MNDTIYTSIKELRLIVVNLSNLVVATLLSQCRLSYYLPNYYLHIFTKCKIRN
jgi:hypothetical protein